MDDAVKSHKNAPDTNEQNNKTNPSVCVRFIHSHDENGGGGSGSGGVVLVATADKAITSECLTQFLISLVYLRPTYIQDDGGGIGWTGKCC